MDYLFANTFSESYHGLCAHCSQRLSLSCVIASVYIVGADSTSVRCLVRRFDGLCDSFLGVSTINLSFRNNMQMTSRNKKDVGLVYCIYIYYIFWVCVYSLRYPGRKANSPYYIVICVLSGCTIILHVIS